MLSQKQCNAMALMFIQQSEHARQKEMKHQRDLAYIDLNNLYLQIQAGRKRLTITSANRLRLLLSAAYLPADEILINWWMNQFEKLPNWLNV